jgi:hypothetical protein
MAIIDYQWDKWMNEICDANDSPNHTQLKPNPKKQELLFTSK